MQDGYLKTTPRFGGSRVFTPSDRKKKTPANNQSYQRLVTTVDSKELGV